MQPHPFQAELQAAAVEFALDEHFFETGGRGKAGREMLLQVGIAGADDERQLESGLVSKTGP